MQDFPEEGEGKMSQVQHGEKMLYGLPDELAPPSVMVEKRVYFVNELLQQKNHTYFIPTKFFQTQMGVDQAPEVLEIGHTVLHTDVSQFSYKILLDNDCGIGWLFCSF